MTTPDLQRHIENICADVQHHKTSILPALADEYKTADHDTQIFKARLCVANNHSKNLKKAIAKEKAKSECYIIRINEEKAALAIAQDENNAIKESTIDERNRTCQNVENYNTIIDAMCTDFRELPDRYKPEKLSAEVNEMIENRNSLQNAVAALELHISEIIKQIQEPRHDEEVMRESINAVMQDSINLENTTKKLQSKRDYLNKLLEELTQQISQLKMKGFDNIYPLKNN